MPIYTRPDGLKNVYPSKAIVIIIFAAWFNALARTSSHSSFLFGLRSPLCVFFNSEGVQNILAISLLYIK